MCFLRVLEREACHGSHSERVAPTQDSSLGPGQAGGRVCLSDPLLPNLDTWPLAPAWPTFSDKRWESLLRRPGGRSLV